MGCASIPPAGYAFQRGNNASALPRSIACRNAGASSSLCNPFTAAAIEKYGTAATQATVSVDKVTLSLGEGKGAISGLNVGNPPGFTTPKAFEMGMLQLAIDSSSVTANPVVINSRIVDNSTELVRLTVTNYNTGAVQITNGGNTYSGGTIVNAPNAGQTGFLDLNVTGATGATGASAIPLAATVADSLIINGGTVRLLQNDQIHFGITPVLRGNLATLKIGRAHV